MSIAAENRETCLKVTDLKMYFPVKSGIFSKARSLKAVDGVSFSIAQGETMGLVGESGCGKTTVGRTILKLYEATGGSIVYKGTNITGFDDQEMRPYRRKMQMIFQDPYTSLDPRMNVEAIISEPIRALKLCSEGDRRDRVRELIQMVGLKADHLNRYPHEFSGGQRQRIGIARALAAEPEFIVCDEPISALDVSIQAQVINILEELQHKFGFTYLFISHDLSMVRHISHQVGVMYLGNLIEYAQVDELYDNMLHPYTKSLISAVPVADPNQARQNKRIVLQGDVPSPIDPPPGCPFRARCAYAKEICGREKPELKKINDDHMVACHLY
ncbi:ABC transporter ATP-binding protein [Enterocloster lavalensis]|uniref:Oligopeptide transport system ATP-binding protein n=1 Tax=Enterocloster lavalensis TaxID=460384 RepID=A0A1I0DFS5_9FIRM|nr:oligopeptide/dipeptide ABC transporter ATP-binding protein [Enterocloster lavalensis]PST35194.1 peptide ABC transporter ATP-binding protein [Enterocloster lavalensis]SET30898.1 oligopeptide transport system ATP-binding protein [Enterocloster lavalensis]